jgi:hypothetical protein
MRNRFVIYNIMMSILIIAVIGFFGWGIKTGLEKSEIVECYELREQSEKFPDFYLIQWQKNMCDHHEIEINAPVIGQNY